MTNRVRLLPLVAALCALPAGAAEAGARRTDAPAGPTDPGKPDLAVIAAPPARVLRELATDRPDVTESPYTVDAGHLQLEMDFANYATDRQDGVRTREWGVAPVNLRVGLTGDFELGVFVEPYQRQTEQPDGAVRTARAGPGDVTLRAKVNFQGNDGGAAAYGLIVDCKLPTAVRGLGNGKFEAAVILPVNFELARGWELGAMTRLAAAYGDSGRYRAVWDNTVSLGHDLTADTGGYLELTSSTGDGPHVATVDLGVTWKLDANTQLDAGMNLGVSRRAPDVQFFSGFTRRF